MGKGNKDEHASFLFLLLRIDKSEGRARKEVKERCRST
jgi:hypothetical protein